MYELLQRLKKYRPGLLSELIAKLDQGLVDDFLESESVYSLLKQICSRYNLNEYYAQEIQILLSLLVTKIISNQDFVNELADLVPEDYFNRFRQELEEKLFVPFEVYLYKAGVAYKQLTKLEPQPIPIPEPETKEAAPAATPPPAPAAVPAVPIDLTAPAPASPQQPAEKPVSAPPKPPETIVTEPAKAQTPAAAIQSPIINLQPLAPAKQSFVASQAPRIKVGDVKISQQTPVINVPKPPRPIFQGIQFEAIQETPEIKQEFQGTTEKKEVQFPPLPPVPKTTIQGKEVIDLTNFSVKDTGDKLNEPK